MIEDNFYWYGIAAAVYLVTCWVFAVVRAVHNCGTPKERRDYIWPDRKMQVAVYLSATVLLPGGMDSFQVVLPRNLLFLLRRTDFLLLRHGETVEDVEDHQPSCSHCHLPRHIPARASCLVAVRTADT